MWASILVEVSSSILPVLVWLWLSARHPKADHFYEVSEYDGRAIPEFLELTNDDPGIVVVAAAGGGIQVAAWDVRVGTGQISDDSRFFDRLLPPQDISRASELYALHPESPCLLNLTRAHKYA